MKYLSSDVVRLTPLNNSTKEGNIGCPVQHMDGGIVASQQIQYRDTTCGEVYSKLSKWKDNFEEFINNL